MSKEFDIINYIRNDSPINEDYVIKGPGDDMAVMAIGNEQLLVTADTLLEGVHFDLSHASLEEVGYKSMACSLSDCAAMCSTPIGAIGCTSLPVKFTMEEVKQLHNGVQKASKKYNCPVIGGDITTWDKPLAISITMFSVMKNDRKPVYRNGAKAGDKILVTGELGGSIYGRHLSFEPRVYESHWLYDNCTLNSMMDLSDGIAGDLRHICSESNVSAILYHNQIPVSSAVSSNTEKVMHALTDGEDFELLFSINPSECDNLLDKWAKFSKVPLTIIGEIIPQTNGPEVFLQKDNSISILDKTGWEHKTD